MKAVVAVFTTFVLASFSQAFEPMRPLPSKVTTIDCLGEGQKLKMEWISSPWLSRLTINEKPIEMNGVQMVSDFEGNDTYSKAGILEIALGKQKDSTQPFARKVTLYNKTYNMNCLTASTWRVVQ